MKRFPRSWFISRVTCLMHFPRSINDDIKILKNNEIKQNIWIKNIYDKKTFYWRVKRSVTQFLFGVVVLVLKNVSPEKLFFSFQTVDSRIFPFIWRIFVKQSKFAIGLQTGQDKSHGCWASSLGQRWDEINEQLSSHYMYLYTVQQTGVGNEENKRTEQNVLINQQILSTSRKRDL